ncbi:hypothetical protein [Streptomyces sp. HNM0575]|uniref:three-helix bundle dimerization domain-containing protein n=1 Tax=Streptomyces sp. HNM0575 TaxID=2716338 RepID=UPI001F0E8A05|nr:hypothetical protein [Streptomyces sp. HNM0575]
MTALISPLPPDARLATSAARLAARHQGTYSVETVQRLLADSYTRLAAHARIRAPT